MGRTDLPEPLVDGDDLAFLKARIAPSSGARPEGSPDVSAPEVTELCFYGLCGGAGVTTAAAAVGFGRDGSARGLPEPSAVRRLPVVAVTRSNAHGLMRAQQEAAAWTAHQLGPWHRLGLVVVADAPGRLPRPLRDLRKLVSGGWPRLWHIDWIEDLRLGEPPTTVAGERTIAKLRKDLLGLVPELNQTKEEPCPT